ncbi:HNH endonuclease [Neoroseomonas eburnea]|nr:HNH endonuclease [Neoroseomonas eburnea]
MNAKKDPKKFHYTVEIIKEEMNLAGGEIRIEDLMENLMTKYPQIKIKYKFPRKTLQGFIQYRSSDSEAYGKKEDIFYNKKPKGSGVWGLRRLAISTEKASRQSLRGAGIADLDDFIEAFEGTPRVVEHVMRERSPALIRAFKQSLRSWSCTVCGFDFAAQYGDIGKGFIEAHHAVPLAKAGAGRKVKPSDLMAVCSNCHRMLHRLDDLQMDTLRQCIADAKESPPRDRSAGGTASPTSRASVSRGRAG